MSKTPDTPPPTVPETQHVIVERIDDVLRVTLNRTAALNALTTPMVHAITQALQQHEGRVAAVLFDSRHPKAFCAGGDIRAIRENTLAEAYARSHEFFADEYALNALIASYPHPIISLIDGVCMGGGMGLAIHGSARVVTQNAVMAMPETAIGFFPDVGASYFLSRLPGALGMYWGLTGARISSGDAMRSGLATHFVADITADELLHELLGRGTRSVQDVLDGLAEDSPEGETMRHRERIDAVFDAASIPEIRARLGAAPDEWAEQAGALLAGVSPQSLVITHALLRWARDASLEECLRVELGLADEVTRSADFVEGVRSVLVDKDRNPRWSRVTFTGLDHAGRAAWGSPIL